MVRQLEDNRERDTGYMEESRTFKRRLGEKNLNGNKGKIFSNLDLQSRDRGKLPRRGDYIGGTTPYFQQHLDQVLQGLPYCCYYIDDIVVWSSSIKEHLIHLEEVFQRLRHAKLNNHPDKCIFSTTYVVSCHISSCLSTRTKHY